MRLGQLAVLSLMIVVMFGCDGPSPLPSELAPPPLPTGKTTSPDVSVTAHSASGAPAVATPPTPGARSVSQHVDLPSLKRGIVRVDFLNGGPLGYGVVAERSSTGFDVITADHVLGENRNVIVQSWRTINGQDQLQPHTNVSVMHRDPLKDLAWLRVRSDNDDVDVLVLGGQMDENLENWEGWCYRDDRGTAEFIPMKVSHRSLAKRTVQDRPVSYWQLAEKVDPGMSGGPLLTQEGKWVGIASGNSQEKAYYVDEKELRDFLRAVGLK